MLEISGARESVPVGDGGQYETVVLDAELRLRRIGRDGTTRWVTPLGTPTDFEADATPQLLRVADDAIHVVWPRFDGALPARYPAYNRFTLTHATIDFDGAVAEQVELASGATDTDRPEGEWPRSFALDDTGAAIAGEVLGDSFTVSKHRADGSIEWSATSPAIEETRPMLATIGGSTVVASGGSVLLLDERGVEQWRVAGAPTQLATTTDVEIELGDGAPVVLLTMYEEEQEQPWLCILDLDGDQRAAVGLGSNGIWQMIRAWPIDGGLLVYAEMPAAGVAHGLYVFDFATQTRLAELIISGSGYDDEPTPGSGTGGIERLADGSLLMIGYEENGPAGGPDGDEFERWDFLLQLTPAAGNGHLDDLPLLDDS